jgi:glycosyltransferase involved in cell wall biosynthesis
MPEVVHHVAIKPVLFGSIAARLASVPKVINAIAGLGHVFASSSKLLLQLRLCMRFILASPKSIIIVQNPEDQKELEALTKRPVHLILGAGVNTDEFCSPIESRSRESNQSIVITHASRLLWSKGVGELVEASRILKSKGYNITTQIVGEPDTENPDAISKEILESWHKECVIKWLGYQSDMITIYQQSDIAVLASYYREGIPKTLIEAASTGLPIITTTMPGCKLIVQNGHNGLLIQPRSVDALIEALERLVNNQNLRSEMGHHSRSMVLEKFDAKLIYNQTIRLYQI